MKKFYRVLSALSAMIFTASLLPSEAFADERTAPSGVPFDKLGERINECAQEQSYPSYRVSVFCGDEIIYEGGDGYIDKDNELFADSDTVYEWGSVTKLFTWVSVMQLYEQGKIDLNADVRVYLPDDFVKRLKYQEPITMMDLMNHTPGFEETVRNIATDDAGSVRTLSEALIYSEPNQVFHPGEITAYSNWGAALAGYIVECVSGESFADYVHRHILEPAGMERTSIAPDHSDNAWVKAQREKVYCYIALETNGETVLIPRGKELVFIEPYPAGAAAGTISDLAKFGQALVSDNCPFFEKQETAELMFSASSFYGDSDVPRICHGFFPTQGSVQHLGHGGNTNGFSASLEFDRESKLGCAIAVNQYADQGVTVGIPALLFGEQSAGEYANAPTVPTDISGTYIQSRGQIINSVKANSYLSPIELKSAGNGEYTLNGEQTFRPIGNGLVVLSSEEGSAVYGLSADGRRINLGSTEIMRTDSAAALHALIFVYIGIAAAGFLAVIVLWIMRILKKRRRLRGALPICAANIAKVCSCLSFLALLMLSNEHMGLPLSTIIVHAVIQTVCVLLYALSAASDALLLIKKTGGTASRVMYCADILMNITTIATALIFNVCGV